MGSLRRRWLLFLDLLLVRDREGFPCLCNRQFAKAQSENAPVMAQSLGMGRTGAFNFEDQVQTRSKMFWSGQGRREPAWSAAPRFCWREFPLGYGLIAAVNANIDTLMVLPRQMREGESVTEKQSVWFRSEASPTVQRGCQWSMCPVHNSVSDQPLPMKSRKSSASLKLMSSPIR